MTRGVPVFDPKRDLKGATPEKLAKALFRRTEPLPARVRQPVAGDEVALEEVAADEPGSVAVAAPGLSASELEFSRRGYNPVPWTPIHQLHRPRLLPRS